MGRRLFGLCAVVAGCAGSDPGPRSAPGEVPASDPDVEPGTVCSSSPGGAGTARVVVRGATRAGEACALLRTVAGSAYDEVLGDADVHALFATGAFEDVVLVREAWAGRTSLVFEVAERPILAAVEVRGATSPEALAAVRDLPPSPARIDPVWVHASKRELAAALDRDGYRGARVDFQIEDGNVIFVIDEGARTLLRAVRIEGLVLAKESALRGQLRHAPGEPFSEGLLERDRLVLQWSLLRQGFLDAEVTSRAAFDPEDHAATVVLGVREGRRYTLGSLVLAGDISEELRRSIQKRLPLGKPLDVAGASDLVTDLERELRKSGRRVKVERAIVPDRTTGAAALEIRVADE